MKSLVCGVCILSCLVIFSVVCTLSCRKSKSPKEADVNQTESQATAQIPADNPNVAVTVNGVEINESQVQDLIEPELEQMSQNASQLPPSFLEQYRKQLREQALEQLIIEQLLDEKLKDANIEISDEQIISAITQMVSTRQEPLTLEEYKMKLVEHGQSFDEQKERIRKGLSYEKVLEAQLEGKVNITEDDARKFYDENPKQFERGEQVRASHILIKPIFDKDGDPNEAKGAAKAKAQELLKQLKGGADLAGLARSNSACLSASRGGDLGFFSKGDLAPAFEKVAFELKFGQISDIVETEYGYHIIKVTDHRDPGIIPFDEIKESIIIELTNNKKVELTNEYFESLKAEADIVYPSGNES